MKYEHKKEKKTLNEITTTKKLNLSQNNSVENYFSHDF